MVEYPNYIIGDCLGGEPQHRVRVQEEETFTFSTESFEWDDHHTKLGNGTICVSRIEIDYLGRTDHVLEVYFDAFRFSESFYLYYHFGPCYSQIWR